MPKHIITPFPFRFDGHGVNDANGQRIAKVESCGPYTYDSGSPVRNAEFDYLSNLFKAAPLLYDVLVEHMEALHEAHDTHIFGPDDPHDSVTCSYCVLAMRGREVLREARGREAK
jgi:hypothetical protein